jgi:hypothetical protein
MTQDSNQPAPEEANHDERDRRKNLVICLFLAFCCLAAYWPVRHYAFVNYDDEAGIVETPAIRSGLTWHNVGWAFRHTHLGNWQPLTSLSHMLDCEVFGLQPGPPHLENVLFHCANTVLLFLLLQRMTDARWRSIFVAALFGLHPLHVESVAWISERKDVLSTFFGFLTLLAYVRYVQEKEKSSIQYPASSIRPHASRFTFHVSRFTHHASFFYCLSLFLFALGLMSKPCSSVCRFCYSCSTSGLFTVSAPQPSTSARPARSNP